MARADDEAGLEALVWAAERNALRTALATRRWVAARSGRVRPSAPVADWSRQPTETLETVIVGDSIVRRCPQAILATLDRNTVVNHGWGGDTVGDVRRRIMVSLSREPRRVILQVGTNDLLQGRSPAAVVADLRELAATTATALSGADLAMCAIPPIARWRTKVSSVRALNDHLRTIAESVDARYVDVFGALSTDAGTPRPDTSSDGVHLTRSGYELYVTQLRSALAGDS